MSFLEDRDRDRYRDRSSCDSSFFFPPTRRNLVDYSPKNTNSVTQLNIRNITSTSSVFTTLFSTPNSNLRLTTSSLKWQNPTSTLPSMVLLYLHTHTHHLSCHDYRQTVGNKIWYRLLCPKPNTVGFRHKRWQNSKKKMTIFCVCSSSVLLHHLHRRTPYW